MVWPPVTCTLSVQVLRASGKEIDGAQAIHLSDSLQNFIHHLKLVHKQQSMEREFTKTIDDVKDESKKYQADLAQRIDNLEKKVDPHSRTKDQSNVDNSVARKLQDLEARDVHNQSVIKALRKEAHDLKGEIQALRREVQQLQRTGQPFMRQTGTTSRERLEMQG